MMAKMQQRTQTRFGDLLVTHYRRIFSNPHEAKDFADKLKTEMLPAVRKLINSYQSFRPGKNRRVLKMPSFWDTIFGNKPTRHFQER